MCSQYNFINNCQELLFIDSELSMILLIIVSNVEHDYFLWVWLALLYDM